MARVRFAMVFALLFMMGSVALAQEHQVTFTLDSEGPLDGVTGGVDYAIGPVPAEFTIDMTLGILVTYLQPEPQFRFGFYFKIPWPEESDFSKILQTYEDDRFLDILIHTPTLQKGCLSLLGKLTISEADVRQEGTAGNVRLVADHFRAAFEAKCKDPQYTQGIRGTILVEPAQSQPPGGGGSEPPPPPPPPPTYVKIVAPPNGVNLGNTSSATVAISTTVHEGYEGPIHLEAYGPPGLDVTFEPQMIPSPGAGTTAMTIEVGEHVLPMRHLVEIRAVGPPRPTSIVFPVELLCEPPFVSYTGLPTSTIVSPGGTTTLNIDVLGSALLRYQWYEGPTGSIWRPIENATGSSLTVGPVNGTSFYWLRVTNGCGSWDSPTLRVGNSGPRRRPAR